MKIHQVSLRINIAENHFATAIADAIGTGSKSHRSDNHLIARIHAQGTGCQMQPGCRIIHGYCILRPDIPGKSLLKFRDFRSLGQVIGFQRIHYRLYILFGYMLTSVRYRFAYHFTSKFGSTYCFILARNVSTVSQTSFWSEL